MNAYRTATVSVFAAMVVLAAGGVARSRGEDAAPRSTDSAKRAASALERDVVALLAAVDPKSDLAALQAGLAPELAAAVDKYFADLNPPTDPTSGPTAVESTDGRFVVVVIGDAPAGKNGRDVRATSDADLLLVVGGRAGARPAGGECWGGTAHAEATKGIGLALGGTGGRGNGDGVGSGGGGAAGATGVVGSIAVGGPGGKPGPDGGRGTPGSGVDPDRLDAVVKTAKAWDDKR